MQQDEEEAMDGSVPGRKEDGDFTTVSRKKKRTRHEDLNGAKAGVVELLILTKICGVPVRAFLPRSKNSRVGEISDVDTDITEDRLSKIIDSGLSCPKLQNEKETCKVKVRENITFLEAAKVVEEQRKIKRRKKQHVEKPGTGASRPKSQTTAQEADPGAQGSSSPAGAAKAANPYNDGMENHARGLTYRDVTQGTPPKSGGGQKEATLPSRDTGDTAKARDVSSEFAERSTVSKFINLVFNTVRRLLELLPPSGFRTTLNSLLFLEGLLGAAF
ncbi:hypothetical protein HPB47_017408 [Ixodes persulcatus]|uniref:Uncharacterized protein n=1 Tax=Ixodes persulcatus TaxID=34615 RepID=A0AC60QS20_IXOPE|nr:hypothetical protein HPB47_017408 [Ixodes persulcatus]